MTGRLIGMTMLAVLASTGTALAEGKTLDLVEHAGVVQAIEAAPDGDSVGDYLAFNGEIFNADNTTKVGADSGFCMRTVSGARYECTWTIALGDGQIMIAGPFLDAGDSMLAVTGGTGVYSDVRGEMLLHARDDQGSEYDFKLTLE
jgi:allene oxide cyclase